MGAVLALVILTVIAVVILIELSGQFAAKNREVEAGLDTFRAIWRLDLAAQEAREELRHLHDEP